MEIPPVLFKYPHFAIVLEQTIVNKAAAAIHNGIKKHYQNMTFLITTLTNV